MERSADTEPVHTHSSRTTIGHRRTPIGGRNRRERVSHPDLAGVATATPMHDYRAAAARCFLLPDTASYSISAIPLLGDVMSSRNLCFQPGTPTSRNQPASSRLPAIDDGRRRHHAIVKYPNAVSRRARILRETSTLLNRDLQPEQGRCHRILQTGPGSARFYTRTSELRASLPTIRGLTRLGR